MPNKTNEPRLESRKLKDLRPHPLQRSFFDNLTGAEFDALAADIQAHGLRQPIEVMPPRNNAGLPSNTIVDGHQRKRALQMHGALETVVLVRHDLADADAAHVEKAFLSCNQFRRQLDPLAKARVALRLYEIECGRDRGKLDQWEQVDARDRVGQVIGMSGRNLQRYFNVLRAPLPVQDALRRGEISLVVAARVGCLTDKQRAKIAAQIDEGESIDDVVREYFTLGQATNSESVGKSCGRLIRALRRETKMLAPKVAMLDRKRLARCRETLVAGAKLLKAMINRAQTDHVSNAPGSALEELREMDFDSQE